jgi:hypothetical protein
MGEGEREKKSAAALAARISKCENIAKQRSTSIGKRARSSAAICATQKFCRSNDHSRFAIRPCRRFVVAGNTFESFTAYPFG